MALAMAYEGARGETASEMEAVLGFPADAAADQPQISFMHQVRRVQRGSVCFPRQVSPRNAPQFIHHYRHHCIESFAIAFAPRRQQFGNVSSFGHL
jgi:hypothetical protein